MTSSSPKPTRMGVTSFKYRRRADSEMDTLVPWISRASQLPVCEAPIIYSTADTPLAFTDEPDEIIYRPDIAQNLQVPSSSRKPKRFARLGSVMRRAIPIFTIFRPASAASERDTNNTSLSSITKGLESSTLGSPPLPIVITPSPIVESPLPVAAAEAQESVGPSPLTTSSEIVPPTLSPSVEETQGPTGYIIPPVIDSTAGNPGAFTDDYYELPQPDITQDPHSLGPVEPHVELATLNPPEPAEPETIITEALADEPIPYSVEPMEESIKDFETVDHADNTPEFSEAVDGNANVISHEPFADPIAPRITQSVLDMPQYVNLGLPTTSPTPTN